MNSAALQPTIECALGEPVTNGRIIAAGVHCGPKYKLDIIGPNAAFNLAATVLQESQS